MACACNKRRQPTGFGATTPVPAPAERKLPLTPEVYTLRKLDGSTEEFGSKLEALAARTLAGGGTLE